MGHISLLHVQPLLPHQSLMDLIDILATTITLAGEAQVRFDARRHTDPADTVRRRLFPLLDEGDPLLFGEVVYTVAFLTQVHRLVPQ